VKSGDTRDYLMVTRTFRQPGANELVDAQRLTLSSAPLSSRDGESDDIRGLPYGYPHLSSTRGKTSPLMRRDRHRLLYLLSSKDNESGFYSRCPETFKPSDARGSSLLGRDDRVQWRREVSWLSNFVVFKTPKFVDAFDAFSFLSE